MFDELQIWFDQFLIGSSSHLDNSIVADLVRLVIQKLLTNELDFSRDHDKEHNAALIR